MDKVTRKLYDDAEAAEQKYEDFVGEIVGEYDLHRDEYQKLMTLHRASMDHNTNYWLGMASSMKWYTKLRYIIARTFHKSWVLVRR